MFDIVQNGYKGIAKARYNRQNEIIIKYCITIFISSQQFGL